MPVSRLRILPRSCAEAVKDATVPKRAQVFCMLPAARLSTAIPPFLGPRRPQPGRTRCSTQLPPPGAATRASPDLPKSWKPRRIDHSGKVAGRRTARPPHDVCPDGCCLLPAAPRPPSSAQTDSDPPRTAPSPIPILRSTRGAGSGLGGAAGREQLPAMRLRAPLRGNKGGGRRARPCTPPTASLPLGSSAAWPRQKKIYTFFGQALLSANDLFENVHSLPFA